MPPPALPPKETRAEEMHLHENLAGPLWAKRADNSLWAKRAEDSLRAKDIPAPSLTSITNFTSPVDSVALEAHAEVTHLHSDFSKLLARTVAGMHDDFVLLARMDPASKEAKVREKRLLTPAQQIGRRDEMGAEDQDVPVHTVELLAPRDAAEATGREYAASGEVLARGTNAELLARDGLLAHGQLLARHAGLELIARDIDSELLAHDDELLAREQLLARDANPDLLAGDRGLELIARNIAAQLQARHTEAVLVARDLDSELVDDDAEGADLLARDEFPARSAETEMLARAELLARKK